MTLRSSPCAALAALLLAASALPAWPANAARIARRVFDISTAEQRPVPALWPDAHE